MATGNVQNVVTISLHGIVNVETVELFGKDNDLQKNLQLRHIVNWSHLIVDVVVGVFHAI